MTEGEDSHVLEGTKANQTTKENTSVLNSPGSCLLHGQECKFWASEGPESTHILWWLWIFFYFLFKEDNKMKQKLYKNNSAFFIL